MIFRPSIGLNTFVIEHYKDYDNAVKLGYVLDELTNKEAITIIYDPHCFAENGYHLCASIQNGEHYIIMDSTHFPCYYEMPEVLEALILHEVGHFSNGDYEKIHLKADHIKTDRGANIIRGMVQPHELDADKYAAKNVGVPVMMRALDYLIALRKERKDDPIKAAAIREFELRKKALNDLSKEFSS